MADITNPHDRFFKEVLSREEVARDFMLHYTFYVTWRGYGNML